MRCCARVRARRRTPQRTPTLVAPAARRFRFALHPQARGDFFSRVGHRAPRPHTAGNFSVCRRRPPGRLFGTVEGAWRTLAQHPRPRPCRTRKPRARRRDRYPRRFERPHRQQPPARVCAQARTDSGELARLSEHYRHARHGLPHHRRLLRSARHDRAPELGAARAPARHLHGVPAAARGRHRPGSHRCPALANGYVTFGTFHSAFKISPTIAACCGGAHPRARAGVAAARQWQSAASRPETPPARVVCCAAASIRASRAGKSCRGFHSTTISPRSASVDLSRSTRFRITARRPPVSRYGSGTAG